MATTVSDPAKDNRYKVPSSQDESNDQETSVENSDETNDDPNNSSVQQLDVGNDENSAGSDGTIKSYIRDVLQQFCSTAMLLLLLAATCRQLAGFVWAYNTKNYFQKYYPEFDITYWILGCSIGGGSFGVFFGGYLSDRVVSLQIEDPYKTTQKYKPLSL